MLVFLKLYISKLKAAFLNMLHRRIVWQLNGLKFLVQFELPNQTNRARLWEKALPATLPTCRQRTRMRAHTRPGTHRTQGVHAHAHKTHAHAHAPNACTAETIDFNALAQASEKFTLVQIGNTVYRAAANAALRPGAAPAETR